MNRTGTVVRGFQRHFTKSFSTGRLLSALGKHFATAAVFGLLFLAPNCGAQTQLLWIAGSDVWSDPAAWITNNGTSGDVPGALDVAIFTNAGTYTVTLTGNVFGSGGGPSNIFNNASNTTATVTLNANGFGFSSFAYFSFGGTPTATTTVYFVSTTNSPPAVSSNPGTFNIGDGAVATVIITNGTFDLGAVSIGHSKLGSGTLVLSGPHTILAYGEGSNHGGFSVGGVSNSAGNVIIVTNGATLCNTNVSGGTFRFGSSSSQGGTSNNTMLIADGGKLLVDSGTISIGNGSSAYFPGVYNNTLIVGNGGLFDCGPLNTTRSIFVGTTSTPGFGTPASNNVLQILAGGVIRDFSRFVITSNNTLDVEGGSVGGVIATNVFGLGGTISNVTGIVQGYGFFSCAVRYDNSNGVLYTMNSLGSMVFSGGVTIVSNNIVQVELGASPSVTFPSICVSNLTIRGGGTLNITAPGSFANGTYILFTNLCSVCTNQVNFEGWTLGSVPDPSATYTVSCSTNESGGGTNAILLTVSGLTPPLPFQITSITRAPTANDITINFNTKGSNGQFNYVQACPGGNYSTNSFTDIGSVTIAGATASYTDTGGATNRPNRYYRVRSPQ